jgi:hypothetical protein
MSSPNFPASIRTVAAVVFAAILLAASASPAPAAIAFIDNSDAGVTKHLVGGIFGDATNGGAIDGTTSYDNGVGLVFTYSKIVPDAGTYSVWATWVEHVNRSIDVTYAITGGASTTFNQELAPVADLLITTPNLGSRIPGAGGGPTENAPYQLIGQVVLGAGGTLEVKVTNGGTAGPGSGAFGLIDALAYDFEPAVAAVPAPAALPAGLAMLALAAARRRRR